MGTYRIGVMKNFEMETKMSTVNIVLFKVRTQ